MVGNAAGVNTIVNNAVNSADVTGERFVGGIVGNAAGQYGNEDKIEFSNLINTGKITGTDNSIGGLIGKLQFGILNGTSYNLGDISTAGHNVGGLVGYASFSELGDADSMLSNHMDITGDYNVGGIVGILESSDLINAENNGAVYAADYTEDSYNYNTANNVNGSEEKTVYAANVGGIAGYSDGSNISNVLNTADVSSSKKQETVGNSTYEYYTAGNVGGIVGSAVDTNITNVTNRENDVRGAHNVGGVAGYFGNTNDAVESEDYTITNGINDGGDIMATGARNDNGFVTETVRLIKDGANETFIIGNIGGVVGYMDGDDVYVTGSANRGTVHSYDIDADHADNVLDISKAANVGGVVGKINRDNTKTITENKINEAAVSNSYNTGDVRGYTGVGGVVGMMYKGEVAGSYNLGYISTTRQSTTGGSIDALNMGGIVGDTTEHANAKVYLYDVYNKGQIGDENFDYFGRHVGGIVGRLSGTVEKAYNNGAIYNGYNVVGGIAGWMVGGEISNAFNTGNITVLNRNDAGSQVGGIVGAVSDSVDSTIQYAYNLGTLRSFKDTGIQNVGNNSLGGILGHIQDETDSGNISISNVYTTGNLYIDDSDGGIIGSIYGNNTIGNRLTVENAYYIKPQDGLGFDNLADPNNNKDNSNKAIDFFNENGLDKDNIDSYKYTDEYGKEHSLSFSTQTGGKVSDEGDWRIYEGNTPILNAFLPNAEKYFGDEVENPDAMDGISSIQYGTAYDPLLTIIKAKTGTENLSYNWSDLGITSAAGIAVYGAGLTLDSINTSTSGSGYFGGTIYADGALNLNGKTNNINLGSASQIYGSAVNITTDGKVTIYGDVTATGNTDNNVIDTEKAGNITINAGDVDVYGTLTSATKEAEVKIPGISDSAVNWTPGSIDDSKVAMTDIADRFAHTVTSSATGSITINAGTKLDEAGNTVTIGDGNVNIYYGNKENGITTTGGDLTVTATGDVYVDSDLAIGGGLSLTAGADKEIVLDITNIGQVQKNHNQTESVDKLHEFLGKFSSDTNAIEFAGTDDAKITVDMWDGDEFNLNKFDNNKTFAEALENVKVKFDSNENATSASDVTYIWVSSADQLNGIQSYYDEVTAQGDQTGILNYNFALKNDINASDIENYNIIGTDANGKDIGYNGTFDGRGNRIIGLKVTDENVGIFSSIGKDGVVKNVNIYAGDFKGVEAAGAVAGVNNGRIENIITFGNTVTLTGENGNAGGIVGVNNSGSFSVTDETTGSTNDGVLTGGIYDVESTGTVIVGNANAVANAVAGGLVGTNNGGLANSFSDSAVTSNTGTDAGLGGVVGVNTEKGEVQYVDSLGVTNGGDTGSSNIGGVIGINNGNLYSAYNESIVSGSDNVGGIIGENNGGNNYTNNDGVIVWSKGNVGNVVNATSVTSSGNYAGGLVGSNIGTVENGRNNGTITGTNYVGGMVGDNAENSQLTDLVNDSSASITGVEYVGGIAGSNAGTIITGNEEAGNANLINRGSITGYKYVGGVAGENTNAGVIENANNDVELNVNIAVGSDAQFFGGIVGINNGTINNATNTANVNADGATYVGGIVGQNNGILKDMAGNSGNVTGKNYVGGVVGQNNENIDGVNASNDGTVKATDGGAGGIFAENTGNITDSTLTNNKVVIGTGSGATGGLIGKNSGDINHSSLINGANAQVIGINNVGGLIGINTGTIEGGRDEADSYYKYQIYNNGVINVGTWTDVDGDGEYRFTAQAGSNIGGLIGNNTVENGKTGSLIAGYNTGAINAEGSTNVGGIAGSNSGTIDQVFNTVMTADGTNEAITGGTNVGGLVGNNATGGELSNAYNTTDVIGTTNLGNAVGENSGTVQYVYGVGNLIGNNTANAKVSYAYDISDDSATWLQSEAYEGFTFGTNGKWMIYGGSTNPLLSVFLTKVTVVDQHKVNEYFSAKHYGEFQQITAEDINALIALGAISAPDADGFDAFKNANGLISGVAGDLGAYTNWLYSGQIASSGSGTAFNPNNLGYDISLIYSPFEADMEQSSRWDYLFNDNLFDRNRNFRERKAEVNFVDGGMDI